MKKDHRIERRLHPRRPYRMRIVFEDEFGDGLFYVFSEDVSMGGLFLASDIPVRNGAMLFLSFQLLPYKRPIRVTGEVVRRIERGSLPAGIGIRFVGLPEISQKRLEQFLSS